MAVENNLIDVEALGEAKSIDFANKMGERLNKLFEALGITNKIPMNVGSALKQYRFNVVESEAPNGNVEEGEIIPLTKVERELVNITELEFRKFRKSTSAEAIQSHGYDLAINRTDAELIRYVQKKFRTDFFNTIDGFVGVIHDIQPQRLTADTVYATAISMFPENVDAVIAVDIEEEQADGGSTPSEA